ncbi:large conductance mechanosensitive channel protein MscL [Phormidesmis priestleyi]|uniref:large conductance mechanosensitive channel protein MscL n=1 Tax=Phormidesmis priestleyi TaxID=268141 RepID=UPI000839E473|nr:large conductance mechanosensitive channel protein MscL [Phormidesmis priestleyi]
MARNGFLADFQKFLMRGNVIDLAVAVIIGEAFNKIVTSLVQDIITPVILNPALQAAKVDDLQNLSANGIKYGVFLAAVINFVVIAFAIFVMIRAFEKAKKRFSLQEAIDEAATTDPVVSSQERLTGAIERLTSSMESR